MQRLAPIEILSLLEGDAKKIMVGAVDELAEAIELGHPYWHWGAVCDRSEALFAFGQDAFGQLASHYVLRNCVHCNCPPSLIAMRDMQDFGVGGPACSRKFRLVG